MKAALIILALFAAGCAKTGVNIIDDTNFPTKTCGMNITLQNSSSKDLMLSAWGTESTKSAGCKSSSTDENAARVPAGESATVELNMQCQSCDIHPVTAVFSGMGKTGQIYSGSFHYKIVCTDSECKGEN